MSPIPSCLGIGGHTGGSRQGHPRFTGDRSAGRLWLARSTVQHSKQCRNTPNMVAEQCRSTTRALMTSAECCKTIHDDQCRNVSASRSRVVECVDKGCDRFLYRLELFRKRLRNWARTRDSLSPNEMGRCGKGDDSTGQVCGKELELWDPTIPGTFASMGPFECVMFFTFHSAEVETWSKWCDDSEDLVLGCPEGTVSS